jgi:RNA-directed DNA polymerase
VARPEDRHFLGFRLRISPRDGTVEILLSVRSRERAFQRIRELTPRQYGGSLESCIRRVNVYLVGWFGFFQIRSAVEDYSMRGATGPLEDEADDSPQAHYSGGPTRDSMAPCLSRS